MSVEKFSALFDGLALAYGTYKIEKTQSNGKNTGKATIVREPRTTALWEGHLSGKGQGIGIVPINEDNMCVWGCVDVEAQAASCCVPIKIRRGALFFVHHGPCRCKGYAGYIAEHIGGTGLWRQ